MQTLSPLLAWVCYFPAVTCCTECTKFGVLDILWYQVYRATFSGIQGTDELRKNMNVLVYIVFHVTEK